MPEQQVRPPRQGPATRQQGAPPRQGRPPSPPTGGPGHGPGPGRPADHGPAPDEAAQRDALRWVRLFGLAMVAALGLGLLTLPWPWALLPGLLCLAALALGIVALVKVRSAKVRGAVTPVLVVGLVLAAFLALAASGQVVLWREYSAYSRCMDGAITGQAKDSCIAQLERSLEDRMQQVLEAPQG
ncbi:hypothetical protein [Georgenia daeguensis]|uniref:Cytochrome d ubiquinol oxidase subunit II n=1 Tax=Georgenia daeguensis TaxID=908355 RepID=A0ABP8EUS5_9MICO